MIPTPPPPTPLEWFRFFVMHPPARVAAMRDCERELQAAQTSHTTITLDEQARCAAAARAQRAAINRGKTHAKQGTP